MFNKLKNKLKDWTKKLTKKAEEAPEEEVQEEVKEEVEETKETEPKKPEEAPEEEPKKKTKAEKKAEKLAKKELVREKKRLEKEERKAIKKLAKKEKLPEREERKSISEIIEEEEIEEEAEKEIKKDFEKIDETEKEYEKEKEELEAEEESPVSEKPEKKSFFQRIVSKISKVKISEEDFDVYADELEMLLIENNVALEVAEKIVKDLRKDIVGKEMLKKEIEGQIQESFKDIIRNILIEPFDLIEKIKEFRKENKDEPYVILFCGVNGTGKTTSIAKIAQQMKDNKLKTVLAAADTFRAASIEQLKKHASKLDLKVIAHDYGSDPAAVGFDAIKYAKKNKLDVVLVDTAGRMHTEKNLMAQIEKVAKVTKPQTKIFVGESITGNDIVEQVRSFDWAVQIDGIILTKADIDEKGGTALSVGYVTKKPILYLGTGQEYDKIEPFDKEKFIEKLGLNEEE